MKCLVLAAGYATRLYPLTENFPKPLLEVKGKTILDWLLDDIDKSEKINEYIIVSNHKFINHFEKWKESKKLSSPITIIDDGTMSNEERLGAVVDINLVIQKLNIKEELLVIAGDNLLDFSLCEFIEYYNKKQTTCVMRYFEENKEKIKKSACLLIDANDLVLNMEEKPNEPKSNWCCPAFYIYSKSAVKEVNNAINNGCAKDAPGSYIAYLYDKEEVHAMEMPGKRYDIGNMESYKWACDNYLEKI